MSVRFAGFRTLFGALNCIKHKYKSTSLNGFCEISKPSVTYCNLLKLRNYSTSANSDDTLPSEDGPRSTRVSGINASKYKLFEDFDAPVILDVDEERRLRLEHPELFEEDEDKKEDEFAGLNLERGVTGVFEVDELVEILKKENATNICAIAISPEHNYVDYMVIVSGRSSRHIIAMAEFIKKLYKKKKHEDDFFPVIEGKESPEWMAIDLGNIALHFQAGDVRKKYDIETLWSVGRECDDKVNAKEDQYITLLKDHTELADIEPIQHVPIPEEIRRKFEKN